MAFDSIPGGDPCGPVCGRCGQPFLDGEATTKMHFADDPHGHKGFSGRPWHSRCAGVFDTFDRALDALRRAASL